MILVLDNRDSFTFNLVQYLLELGTRVEVRRSGAIDVAGARALGPAGILIGPGPGTPAGAGCSEDVVRELGSEIPILGVCLGMQAMATALGGRLRSAHELVHGSTRAVAHDGRGVFRGLPERFSVARYHSLAVDPASVPAELEVTARADDGELMGLRHRDRPMEGVQFHPEAILSEHGHALLANFLELAAQRSGRGPTASVRSGQASSSARRGSGRSPSRRESER